MKPDRFEKMVEKDTGLKAPGVLNAQIVKLLRMEHRAVVRLVKQLQQPYLSCRNPEEALLYAQKVDMCADILAALAKRRGKR